ncbi:MAG: hypothetical protein LBE46_00210 [Wolbachia pipientis]|jgi:DNA repair exonuclease SbcCD ATPase subunit|nr:hypothetical protein [Wolbachia pipientis]
MTVKLDSGGIQSVIGEPKFGDLKFTPEETKDKILKLVEQNKEVFINGKTLYQAFTDMGQSVDNTQGPSSQLPILSSSAPSLRRSSLSSVSESSDEDEIFEDDMSSDEEEYEQEGLKDKVDKIINEIEELEEGKETFAKYFAAQAKQLEDLRLERNSFRDKVNEQQRAIFERGQRIKEQEEELQDKNDVIKSLNHQLKDKESEIQSTNRANEELQKKLDQGEIELSKLRAENTELRNDVKKIVKDLKDNHEKQLAEQLMETKKENNTLAETANRLSKELNELQREKEDLEREIRQLEPGRSLADELSEENTKGEIEKLQRQLKEKEGMLTCTQEELASVKESLGSVNKILP